MSTSPMAMLAGLMMLGAAAPVVADEVHPVTLGCPADAKALRQLVAPLKRSSVQTAGTYRHQLTGSVPILGLSSQGLKISSSFPTLVGFALPPAYGAELARRNLECIRGDECSTSVSALPGAVSAAEIGHPRDGGFELRCWYELYSPKDVDELLKDVAVDGPVATESARPVPQLRFTGEERYVVEGRAFDRQRYTVVNRGEFAAELFAPAPTLPPCGNNASAARTWVDFFDATGKRIYGFCALGSAQALDSLWFAVPAGQPRPAAFIELRDRQTGNVHRSNVVPGEGEP